MNRIRNNSNFAKIIHYQNTIEMFPNIMCQHGSQSYKLSIGLHLAKSENAFQNLSLYSL